MNAFDERYKRLTPLQRQVLDRWVAEGMSFADLDRESSRDGATAETYAMPSTDAERSLARIWEDVLEVARVGIDDDYFSLGGDSIRAIVVVARAEAAGLQVSTHDLFDARTIRELAVRALPTVGSTPPPAGLGQPTGTFPLTAMQQGILFHSTSATRPVYVVQATCRLVGAVNVDAFAQAWQAVVDGHAALRCGFRWPPGQAPEQWVEPSAPVPWQHHDWRTLPPSQQAAQLEEYLDFDLHLGLDPGQPPLLRLALIRTGESAYQFLWTHHHLLLDGWSQHLVLADVLAVYEQLCAGRPADVPTRRWSGDFLDRLSESDPAAAERFWRSHLAGLVGTPALPPATRPPAGRATAPRALAEHDRIALERFCRSHRITFTTLVQAGWAMVLHGITGAEDLTFGCTMSGRSEASPGMTEAVGMFINTLPARVRIRPGDALLPWIRSLHDANLRMQRYEHSALPSIVRGVGLGGGRLFDTIVVVENFPTRLVEGMESAGLLIESLDARVDEGYPLVLEVRTGRTTTLRLRYDAAVFGDHNAWSLVATLHAFLLEVPDGADLSLADLGARMRARRQAEADADRESLRADASVRLRASRRAVVEEA